MYHFYQLTLHWLLEIDLVLHPQQDQHGHHLSPQCNNLLIPHQFGFRKGHSTDYAILHIYDKIIESFSKKEHMIGIFMDLSKAFDTIDHQILIHKLNSYGIRGQALSWFKDYLHNRQQYVAFQTHESQKQSIKCGVPQGSILGPLLYYS